MQSPTVKDSCIESIAFSKTVTCADMQAQMESADLYNNFSAVIQNKIVRNLKHLADFSFLLVVEMC